MPPLVYSPWTKFCSTPGQNGQDASAPKVCFTGRDARTETGVPVVAAALIEPDGIPKKIFRVTVPSPVQLQYGTRIIVDSNEPSTSQFFTCFASVQAINLGGTQISFPVPLGDFAKVNEGAPMDPKELEAREKKMQEDLQKKGEEMRKKLEQQGQAPAAK